MDIIIEPKEPLDAYSTPIVQQTSFWSQVKERLGLHSHAFEFAVRNRDIYDGVGGYAATHADFILFIQHLNREDYIAYVPYGPEIEPSECRQSEFIEELSETLKSYLPKHCATTSIGNRIGARPKTMIHAATGWALRTKNFRN